MESYGDALADIETAFKNVGINATTETQKLQLPGVLIIPGRMHFDRLDFDTYSADVEVYLLTSNKGSVQSMNDLQELLLKVTSVFTIEEAEPISLQLSNLSPDPLPGLLVNLDVTISKD